MSNSPRVVPAVAGFLLAVSISSSVIFAQPATTQPATSQPAAEGPTTLTIEDVQAQLSRIESDQNLPENTRVAAANFLRDALEQLNLAKSFRDKADEFRKGREGVPALLEELRANVEKLGKGPEPLPQPASDATLEDLSRKLRELEADLKEQQDKVRRLDEESAQRSERREAIPTLLAAASNRRETASRGLADAGGGNNAVQVQLAQRTKLTAERNAAQEEIRAYQEELQYYDARNDILTLRRDEARLLASQAEARVNEWRKLVSERREADAAQKRAQAEAELRRTPAAIRDLAQQNKDLAKEWDELGPKIKATENDTQEVRALQDSLAAQDKTLQSYGKSSEMTELLGPMMRKLRIELGRARRFERVREQALKSHALAQVRIDESDQESGRLLNMNKAVERRLEEISFADTPFSKDDLARRLEDLLKARLDTLKKLRKDYETHSTDLVELIMGIDALLAKVDQMASDIDERVLWLRSTVPIHRTRLEFDLPMWRNAIRTTLRSWWRDVEQYWTLYGFALLSLLVLAWRQLPLRRNLRMIGELVARPFSDSYTMTLRAVLDTILIALPIPAVLWFAGWRLGLLDVAEDAAAYDFSRAAGTGLLACGTTLFVLLALRHACRRHGIAACHFRWNLKGLTPLRRHLIWLAPALTPLVLVVVATERYGDPMLSASLGRAAFLGAVFFVFAFVWQTLHPERGAASYFFAKRPDALVTKLKWPIFVFALFALIALGIASALGFHYTAIEMSRGVIITLILTIGLILLHALAVRWVFYTQRKLAIAEAQKKRAEAAEAAAEQKEATMAPDVELDDAALNIGAIGEQTRKLLASFAWLGAAIIIWISWADLLPAFVFLEEVTLWTYVSDTVKPDGTTQAVAQSITLMNAFVAVLILAVSYLLARNMPGLLEIVVLRRLPIDAGARFAITSVSRYTIVVVGLAIAFGAIGVGWSKVQWLVAAITVGLGFGLQEIFANFVSGLILLFERPIRIGDTVTVGTTSGTVTRIRIRATTITDWDRKELIIPNKEFVTGQVVNWTLTDQILRVVVKVGVAYGSDVEQAKSILLDVARRNSLVLDQPKPAAWFIEFADSALNLELRCFVKNLDDFLVARDLLNIQVDKAFQDAGIEIAFPQRDIHIRTIQQALSVETNESSELSERVGPGKRLER